MTCPAKIRPFPDDRELSCENDEHCLGNPHVAVIHDYAYPGSKTGIYWYADDRRTFTGIWTPCHHPGCMLPADHRGAHAL